MEKLCPGCYEGDDTCSMSPTEANEKYGVESSAAYHGFQPLPSQVCPTPSSQIRIWKALCRSNQRKLWNNLINK